MVQIYRAVGFFTKDNSGTPGVTQDITCTDPINGTFQPKCVIIWTIGSNTTNSSQTTRDLKGSYGFTDFTTAASIGWASDDNVSPTKTARRTSSKAVSAPEPDASAVAWDATITQLSNGFRCTWDTNDAAGERHGWMALGGPGLDCKVVTWNSPTGTGNPAGRLGITGSGFTPKGAVHIISRSTGVNSLTNNTQHGYGFNDDSLNQITVGYRSANNSANAATNRWMRSARCIGFVTGSEQVNAHIISMDSDGCTLEFDTNAPGVGVWGATLFIGGTNLRLKVGEFTKGAIGTAFDLDVTSVGFKPHAVHFISNSRPIPAGGEQDVMNDADELIGATDFTNQAGMQCMDHNGDAVGTVALYSSNTKCLQIQTHNYDGSVTTSLSNGFRVSFTAGDASDDRFGYLAVRDASLEASMAVATATATALAATTTAQRLMVTATATAAANAMTTSSSGGSSAGMSPATATAAANAMTANNQKLLGVGTATAAAQAMVSGGSALMATATATAAALAITVLGLAGIPNLWLKRRLENSFARTSVRSSHKTDLKIHG